MNVGIIGGGIHGAATAYFLERFGAEGVTVFEVDSIGSGSTGYSAGIIRYHYSDPTHIDLVLRSTELIRNFEEMTGQESGYHENGYLVLYGDHNASELRETVATQQARGVDVRLVQPDELEDYLPGSDPNGVALGAFERNAGFADPYLIATGFAKIANSMGTCFKTNTEVTGLDRTGNRIEAVQTTSGRHEFDYIINAAGTNGAVVSEMAGVPVELRLRESKIVTLTSAETYSSEQPTLSDHSMEPDMYVKPEPTGNFIVGGIDRPWLSAGDPKEGVSEEFMLEVGRRLKRRLPAYTDASIVDSWSGRISVTQDSNPVMGEPEALDNFYNMVGGSGHGFKTAPAFAEAAAQSILGKQPEIDLSRYRLERFREDEYLEGVSSKTYGSN